MIDLRSDTVTRPSKGMLEAMFSAQVGDDVFRDDPTVNQLERQVADLFGKDDALFCPSGTMTNQVAINVHTRPGDEVICHKYAHIYYYEGGSIMRNSGASVCLLDGPRGVITAEEVESHINPDDIHRPVTSLVEAENTMNKGGGTIYRYENLAAISEVCRRHGLKFHLDGARLFNALAETGEPPEKYAALFDSVSVCLSKGLGAPVGSLLLGDKTFIKSARGVRKAFGGAMRQAGYLAAAGIYALNNNVNRLGEDHDRARHLGNLLANLPFVEHVIPVETNIVIFTLRKNGGAGEFLARLKEEDIHALPIDPRTVRFVTHLDFDDAMLMKTESVLKSLA
ncbi:MAG: GntG family PLP-dependent aldolase [Bacteroidota bacterium]